MKKKIARLRRGAKTRHRIREQGAIRLSVHKTPRHMRATLTTADGSKILATASTLEKDISSKLKGTGNISAAEKVGEVIAERAIKAGVKSIAFDRSGFKFHGRVKALAEAARNKGLKF